LFEWNLPYQGTSTLQWNLAIGSCVRQGEHLDAFRYFDEMQRRNIPYDTVTFLQVFSACSTLEEGTMAYERIQVSGLQFDTVVGTAIVTMFGTNGDVHSAERVFDGILVHNVVSWNALLSVYAQNKKFSKAMALFDRMYQQSMSPDKVSFVNIFTTLGRGPIHIGKCKKVHSCAIYVCILHDNVIITSLIYMYGRHGLLYEAKMIFDRFDERNTVTWNAMITVFVQLGYKDDALNIYALMQFAGLMPDKVTFVSLLGTCNAAASLFQARVIHTTILYSRFSLDTVLITSLLNAYGKCGAVRVARELFDSMISKNIVSWNAMIASYVQDGNGGEAIRLFIEMQGQGILPNKVSFIEVHPACSTLQKGQLLHAQFVHGGFVMDDVVASSIISMYGRWGNVKDARKVFGELHNHTLNSWNALIAAYGLNGNAEEAAELFKGMVRQGTSPDDITFVSLLAACSHAGLLYEGHCYFLIMYQDYRIEPTAEHYDCMIDLLCRVGLLDHAACLISKMPCEPSIISWTSLLCSAENGQRGDSDTMMQQLLCL
jgi:pentatricopeptide repeat protein